MTGAVWKSHLYTKLQYKSAATTGEDAKMTLICPPTIDVSSVFMDTASSDSTSREVVVKEIAQACREWGFFYIKNHNISSEVCRTFRDEAVTFFHSLTKDDLRRTQKNSRGYYDDELTKNKRDWKQGFDFGAQDGSLDQKGLDGWNQWPANAPKFESTMRNYFAKMQFVAARLLELMLEGLNLDASNASPVVRAFDEHSSYLRLNYYPICPDPSSSMAVHHHTDAGALTVLYQDQHVQSLQVQRDNEWFDVAPIEDTFVINVGDMIQVWSNDEFIAPVHRVKANASVDRFSAPFFYNPSYATDVKPIPPSAGPTFTPHYRALNWGHFRHLRFAGDYADLGEEVQIQHYRTQATQNN